jgi:hypothetical protein
LDPAAVKYQQKVHPIPPLLP